MVETDLELIRSFVEKSARIELPEISAATLLEVLPIDSLDMYSLIAELEEVHGKTMPDSDYQNMKTVGDLTNYFK